MRTAKSARDLSRMLCGACLISLIWSADARSDDAIYMGASPYELQKREALLIGISELAYKAGFQSLKNPGNDTKAIAEKLENLGFFVHNLADTVGPKGMTRRNIKQALYDLLQTIKGTTSVGLVYVAGHGIKVHGGPQYIVPYDAQLAYVRDLDEELISLRFIIEVLKEAGNPLNFVILDTCRNNPFKDGKGLRAFETRKHTPTEDIAPENVVLMYSTLSGEVAADGVEEHSPFAKAFLAALESRDTPSPNVLGRVARTVRLQRTPEGEPLQVPRTIDAGHEFIFAPTAKSFNIEAANWIPIATQGNAGFAEKHQLYFPGGYFYDEAAALRRDVIAGNYRQPAPDELPVMVAEAETPSPGPLAGLPPETAAPALTITQPAPAMIPNQIAPPGSGTSRTRTPGETVIKSGWNMRETPNGPVIGVTMQEMDAFAIQEPVSTVSDTWWRVKPKQGKDFFYVAQGAIKEALPPADAFTSVSVNKGSKIIDGNITADIFSFWNAIPRSQNYVQSYLEPYGTITADVHARTTTPPTQLKIPRELDTGYASTILEALEQANKKPLADIQFETDDGKTVTFLKVDDQTPPIRNVVLPIHDPGNREQQKTAWMNFVAKIPELTAKGINLTEAAVEYRALPKPDYSRKMAIADQPDFLLQYWAVQ